MRAPKTKTNQPTRQLSAWVAPYQEEWVREQARAAFPDAGPGINSAVSRYLRTLIDAEMERARA